MNPELPQVYRHHAICCHQQRPPDHPHGSCATAGSLPLCDHLGKQLQAQQLSDIGLTAAGCLGFCSAGPLMVVYPEGIWYQPRTLQDIDEIVQSHFIEGRWVERLAVVLRR
jgi:(2Fe-2S) ferredoxin